MLRSSEYIVEATGSQTETSIAQTNEQQLKLDGKQENRSPYSKDDQPKLNEDSNVCLKSGPPKENEFLESQEEIEHAVSTNNGKLDEVNTAVGLNITSLNEQQAANTKGSLGKNKSDQSSKSNFLSA